MKVVEIREFMKFTPKELSDGLRTDLDVLLEDGTVKKLSYKEIILLRYMLEVLLVYPQIKIESRHMISNYYTNGLFTGKALSQWCDVAIKDIIFQVIKPASDRSLLVPVYKKLYEVFNMIYNEVVYNNLKYSGSINIEDLLEVQMDENLLKAMKEVAVKKSPEAVNKTYEILEDIIYNKESIKDNQIVKGYTSKSINVNQVKQLLGSRGYVTEIDNHIFKTPIASSFTLGMQSIYDMAIESRSGAKALFVSGRAIQNSEYFARELQLATMVVERLVDGDCGSQDYIEWYVEPGSENKKPDLPNMLGVHFINPETGKEDIITENHGKLINGKKIKIRTALGCQHPDPNCICTSCFGELSYAVPLNSNLGHFCSTEMTEKVSQGILSTKHLVSSASSAAVVLDKVAEQFFTIKDGTSYLFKIKNILQSEDYYLVIDQQSGFGLRDLKPGVDVYKLNPERITRIENIFIIHKNKKGEETTYPIIIKQGNKCGYFTTEFLNYIVNNSYSIDNQDRYVIDLRKWDAKIPLINMPEVEFDFLTLVKQVVNIFKHMETDRVGIGFETPESLLQKLFDKVNYKLNINVALLAVLVYAFTVKDPDNGNFALARGVKNKKLGKLNTIMKNRSMGGAYGWEKVTDSVLSPRSFDGNNAVEHPMDVFIAPNEVINQHYNKKGK